MRARVVAVAMELFGRQGFKATTIAQIEQAAGLSVGGGGIYRHYRSKRALLEAGLQQKAADGAPLLDLLTEQDLTAPSLEERLLVVARAGLRRLDQERDVNRLLLHDLADFPDLLETFRQNELGRLFEALRTWLRSQSGDTAVDIDALAAVLIEALSHHWVLTDVFGSNPFQIADDRYLTMLARMAAATLEPENP